MKRITFALGILIVAVTVFEVRATRVAGGPAIQPARSVTAPKFVSAEGRVVTYPGAEVTIGTDVGGTIARMNVEEKDTVRKGQVIATIKADDTRAALVEARSRVGEADADIRLFESQRDRARRLWTEDVGSKEAVDKAERDLDAGRARRASAVAEANRLEAVLAKTEIVASIDGVVITRFVHPGETVASGASIVTIADLKRTRVETEVDEFDSGRIALGAPVSISAEGFDGKPWRGTVEEIPDSVTSRRLKPQDPSKPIDTRVLLVKIALGEATPLKLGQRVDVHIDAR
jgi:RND family efflux transporter MFP subunit